MRSTLAALAAGLAWLAPAAHAQDQQQDDRDPGLWCVYESLGVSFDYEVVAEAYLFDGDQTGDPGGALTEAGKTCATRHGLSESQQFLVQEYGRFGSVIDYLSEELVFGGATDDELTAVFNVVQTLSDEDYDDLFEDNWQATDAGTRVRAELVKASFPDDADSIATALMIVETIARAAEVELVYMLDKAEAEANDN